MFKLKNKIHILILKIKFLFFTYFNLVFKIYIINHENIT